MKEVWKTSGNREAAGSARRPEAGLTDVKTDSPKRTRIDEEELIIGRPRLAMIPALIVSIQQFGYKKRLGED